MTTSNEAAPREPAAQEVVPEPAEPPAQAEPERGETEFVNHFPAAIGEALPAPNGLREVSIESALIRVDLPSGVAPERRGGSGGGSRFAAGSWTSFRGAPAAVALYAHNPAGDDGADCPTLAEIRGRLEGAEIIVERRFESMWSGEGPVYGDEIDVIVFRRGEQGGFFVRKLFDHGDDYTVACAAFGGRATPFDLSTTASVDEAKAMATAFLTMREQY